MNIEQVREYTLSLPAVTEDQAFGDDIINFRLEGKIFVCLWLGSDKHSAKDGASRFAIKLTPDRNTELRERFSAVTPAYHWNKTHWSDIYYEQLDDAIESALFMKSQINREGEDFYYINTLFSISQSFFICNFFQHFNSYLLYLF